MILGEGNRTADSAATLDDLFRRAGVRHPDVLALADAPNREDFTDGAPRTLTFAEADRAISAFAAKLRQIGLRTDAIVALQLPNNVESVIAFLGVLRAGMIAAPISSVYPGMGGQVLIICFVVVVIGGIGSVRGAFIAALLVGFVDTFGKVFFQEAAGVLVYLMMAAILLWKPEGLFRQG